MKPTSLPFMLIRGGSSKGVFFHKKDLPEDQKEREKTILAAMEGVGQGDPRQIDGLGGADSLTAKVAVVSPSEREGVDLEYLFYQTVIGEGWLSTSQNCGNILAGVLPFAIQSGLMEAQDRVTKATIYMANSDSLAEVQVKTPNKEIQTKGRTKVAGVPGTGSPIVCSYLDLAGKNCGALLPTGNVIDVVDGIEVNCIDNGMPVITLRASDLGITGYESKDELEANEELKDRLESIRLKMGPKMNLGDVSKKTVPKMNLISAPRNGGIIHTRMFIPHVVHAAIGALAAVSAVTTCLLLGGIAEGLADIPNDLSKPISIEHPSGNFDVNLEVKETDEGLTFPKSGVIRTARIIAQGEVFLPF